MAKDGTSRGGPRLGSGRKTKALADKILEGKSTNDFDELSIDDNLVGFEMPPTKDWMSARQKNGTDLCAKDVYRDTYIWLHKVGCDDKVPQSTVERYAMSVARWIQCEMAISEFGMLAKHPTTGQPMASPYVSMAQSFMKQINQCWYPIMQVVRDNSLGNYQGASPQDDLMERLLTARK